MRYFNIITILSVLFFCQHTCASDPKFEIEAVMDNSGKVVQNLVFMSERDYLATVPEGLKSLMDLSPVTHTIIEPAAVFQFTPGIEQKFYPVDQDSYAILEAKNFNTIPHILTSNLCECVGLSLYAPDDKAGVMHVGFRSLDEKLIDEFLNHFACYDKSTVKVRVMSSYYSIVLKEVCDKLAQFGFQRPEADIVPIYLDCQNRTSSGTKYYNYEKMGCTPAKAKSIKEMPEEQSLKIIEDMSGLNMIFCKTRRVLILDARDGSSCQFFPIGNGEANSNLVHMFYKLVNMFSMIRPLTRHKELFDGAVGLFKKRYEDLLAEKRLSAEAYEHKKK